jgi:hypothetical protein
MEYQKAYDLYRTDIEVAERKVMAAMGETSQSAA